MHPDYHLRGIVLPKPGTLATLEARVAVLHSDCSTGNVRSWMFYLIEGLRCGYRCRYSQASRLTRWRCGRALTNALLDPTPEPREMPRPRGRPLEATPTRFRLVGAALRNNAGQYAKLLRHLPNSRGYSAVSSVRARRIGGRRPAVARRPARSARGHSSTSPITPERSFATASIPLAEVKAIAERHEATVNDVVLTLASGALRRYLARHGGAPMRPLVAAMPVSLREAGDDAYSIRATMVLASLATDLADPVARLAAIHMSAGAGKALASRARSVIPTDFPSLGAPWLLGAISSVYRRAQSLASFPPLANVVSVERVGSAVAALPGRCPNAHVLARVDCHARSRTRHYGTKLLRLARLRLDRRTPGRARHETAGPRVVCGPRRTESDRTAFCRACAACRAPPPPAKRRARVWG